MFIIALSLSGYYLVILFLLSLGIFRLKRPPEPPVLQQISVIVAARNEERNIENLLEHLLAQDYPAAKYEIIIVDDRSADRTSQLVSEFRHRSELIRLLRIEPDKPGGKKRALAKGISASRFPLLAFTDSDCLPPPTWLPEINRHFTPDTGFIAGYSPLIRKSNNLLLRLKNLERLSIFAVTAGSMGWNYGLTCAARNMAYRKSIYRQVGGFAGMEDLPSGDDDLMLQRMSSKVKEMNFMFHPGSFVPSYDNKTAAGQINMETRRASKWRLYPLPIMVGSALVFLYYLFFILMLIFAFTGLITPVCFLLLLLLKVIAELAILTPFLLKIGRASALLLYPLAFILHLPYFLFFALRGTFGTYRWK